MKLLRWTGPFFLILFTSCERAIEFTPLNTEPKLVVEATIETREYPVVYLSRSLNFFSTISVEQLAAASIKDAIVRVNSPYSSHLLKQYEVPIGGGNSIYYYSVDSNNLSTAFKGIDGLVYTLSITYNGKEYTSSTTIPNLTTTVDSLYLESNVDAEDSAKVVLYGKFRDAPGFGNYTRYFTSVNGQPYYPGLNSVYDDQVIDGRPYVVPIEQGVDRNSDIDFEDYSYFNRGDAIKVKFCNIDKGTYDFWRTMEYSYASIGNPFSSPTKILGNISNGALGYFGGYAVQYAEITVPQ